MQGLSDSGERGLIKFRGSQRILSMVSTSSLAYIGYLIGDVRVSLLCALILQRVETLVHIKYKLVCRVLLDSLLIHVSCLIPIFYV